MSSLYNILGNCDL